MNNPARTLLLVWLLLPLTSAWSQPSRFEWVRRFPPSSPPALIESAATYDSKRQLMVMFGGNAVTYNDQVWEWNGESWNQVRPPGRYGPDARTSSAMAFDSDRGVCVLFGGFGNRQERSGLFRDTWEWNGNFWKLRSTNGPSARVDHAMAYDLDRKRTVLYGGYAGVPSSAETWEWDGTEWMSAGVRGPPLRRYFHAMVYDAKRKVTLLFGGGGEAPFDGADIAVPTDTWAWDGTEWNRVATSGPSGRFRPKMVYDSQREVVVLLGGWINFNVLTDVWEWNGTQWSEQSVSGLSKRDFPVVTYDSARKQITLFGGATEGSKGEFIKYDETWVLHLRETWVDFNYGGLQTGAFVTPFNTLRQAVEFAPPGTIVKIKAGSTPETLQLTKPATIEAIGGPVIIGHR